jgi:fumarylacetoacetase
MDPTHDPSLSAIVDVPADSDFPIQNLPLGVAEVPDSPHPVVVTRVGDTVVDIHRLDKAGLLTATKPVAVPAGPGGVFATGSLNALMALGPDVRKQLRVDLSGLLSGADDRLRNDAELRAAALHPAGAVTMKMPMRIGDYTDFYASREHATNVGTMFRGPDNALQPNWLHLPVGYHGRASSVVVSGTDVRRPCGQTKADDAPAPSFGPSRLIDYELEFATVVGRSNPLGEPIPMGKAEDHLFGFTLMNDWSARDIQKWEYVPLGPFLAKNFATTISPWIVTLEALEPFRVAGPAQTDPEPLPYLRQTGPQAYDIRLQAHLVAEGLAEPFRLTDTNFKYMYWSAAQQLVHHAATGCNMNPGDLLGSGTISGPEKTSRGCLLELTWRGQEPVELPNGEQRKFLKDGDEVVLTGYAQGDGYRIGFGECRGKLLPAREASA